MGWLLETGTGPWQLSGRFVGFITVVLKNTRPGSGFMKTCRFLKGFEITRIDGSLVLMPRRFGRRE